MADYYEIDLRELLNGERKNQKMDKTLKATVLKVAEFGNEDKMKTTKRLNKLFIGGFIAVIVYMVLLFTDNANNFLGGLCLGISFGMMIVGIIVTSKYATRIKACKVRLFNKLR